MNFHFNCIAVIIHLCPVTKTNKENTNEEYVYKKER